MITFLFVGMIGLFAQTNKVYNEPTSIQRIMLQAAKHVMEAESELNLEIVHLQFDLIIGNEWKYTFRNLSNNWVYLIYAAGEKGQVIDLDLKILKRNIDSGEWEDVIIDESSKSDAGVLVSPNEFAQYAIGIKSAKYSEGYRGSHFFVLIAHEKPE